MTMIETERSYVYDYRDAPRETWRRRRCPVCGLMSIYYTKGEPLGYARFVHVRVVSKGKGQEWGLLRSADRPRVEKGFAYCRGRRPTGFHPEAPWSKKSAPGVDQE
jgi:hypothetical protein